MIIPKDGLQIKPQILISASIELLIHLYDMKNHNEKIERNAFVRYGKSDFLFLRKNTIFKFPLPSLNVGNPLF